MENPLERWTGEFGNNYALRQQDNIEARADLFYKIIRNFTRPISDEDILDVGAGLGHNLEALHKLGYPLDQLFCIEPNPIVENCLQAKEYNVIGESAQDIHAMDSRFNLVFTSGVLIHIPPHDVIKAATEIVRVSKRYVLAIEYFSVEPEAIEYRGNKDMLWKRDFGKMYLDNFPELELVDYGFAWKPATGLDNVTWWLFKK